MINPKEKTEAEKVAEGQAKEIWESWITDSTDFDDSYVKDSVDEEII